MSSTRKVMRDPVPRRRRRSVRGDDGGGVAEPDPATLEPARLHSGRYGLLELFDAGLVASVEGPLLDPFGTKEPGLQQAPEVLACGRLADAELLGDEQPAHAVLDQIAVDLRWKVRLGLLQPLQDQEPALVGQRAERQFHRHVANLPSYELMSTRQYLRAHG